MALGARLLDMAADLVLEAPPTILEIVAHPTRPAAYSIACRGCGTVSAGNEADTSRGYEGTVWFCASALCQASFWRRQKLLRWRQLGSPALKLFIGAVLTDVDVSLYIPDNQVGA
jgi:hypothetical protein